MATAAQRTPHTTAVSCKYRQVLRQQLPNGKGCRNVCLLCPYDTTNNTLALQASSHPALYAMKHPPNDVKCKVCGVHYRALCAASSPASCIATHVLVLGQLLPDLGLPTGVLRGRSARHSAPGSRHRCSRDGCPGGRRRVRHGTCSKHREASISLFSSGLSARLMRTLFEAPKRKNFTVMPRKFI